MSTAIAKNFQVGSDGTATNNFTIRQPATPDGTVRIANGNSGTTTDLVTVTSAGNVGVGTSSPGGTLHLVASSANFLMNQYSADSLGSAAALAKSRGTIASPSAVLTGDSLALFSGGGYNTSSIVYNKAAVQMYAAENWTTTANGSYMTFATTAIGATGRAEAMRITSAGDVGIGTSSPGAKLEIGALGVFRMQTGSTVFNTTPTAGAVDTLVWNTSNSGSGFAWNTNSTERVRITPAGDVGIGTSSPSWMVSVRKDSASASTGQYPVVQVNNANASGYAGLYLNDSTALAGLETRRDTAHLGMYAGGSERARITSGGNFGLGTTNPVYRMQVQANATTYAAVFQNQNASPYGLYINHNGASPNNAGNEFIICWDTTAIRFRVNSNGGIENYQANNVNLSDRREKTNFAPAGDYLSKICAIPVQTFNYIDQNMEEDPGLTLGVVAQDVQSVAPELVSESNLGTKEDPKMRLSIYQTDLQYALMKCIQELKAELDSVKTELALLKGTA